MYKNYNIYYLNYPNWQEFELLATVSLQRVVRALQNVSCIGHEYKLQTSNDILITSKMYERNVDLIAKFK